MSEFNGVSVSEVGDDVAKIRYAAVERGTMTDAQVLYAIEDGTITVMDAEPGRRRPLDLSNFAIEPFAHYLVVAVSVDADGSIQKAPLQSFMPNPNILIQVKASLLTRLCSFSTIVPKNILCLVV